MIRYETLRLTRRAQLIQLNRDTYLTIINDLRGRADIRIDDGSIADRDLTNNWFESLSDYNMIPNIIHYKEVPLTLSSAPYIGATLTFPPVRERKLTTHQRYESIVSPRKVHASYYKLVLNEPYTSHSIVKATSGVDTDELYTKVVECHKKYAAKLAKATMSDEAWATERARRLKVLDAKNVILLKAAMDRIA